jgi:hypothetical protein
VEAAQAQADALAFLVHVHHVDFHFLANAQDLARVLDAVPGQLRQMNQAVGPAQVHKGAEIRDAGDDALEHVALVQGGQQPVLLVLAPIAHRRALGEDQTIPLPVHLHDFELHRLADEPRPPLFGVALGVLLRLPAADNCEAGTKPRTRPTRTITPPRLKPVTTPSKTSCDWKQFLRLMPVLLLLGPRKRNDYVAVAVLRARPRR